MSPDFDDLIQVESDLGRFFTLVDITTDMVVNTVLPPGTSPIGRDQHNNICDMMVIVRTMAGRLLTDMKASTRDLIAREQAARVTRGKRT